MTRFLELGVSPDDLLAVAPAVSAVVLVECLRRRLELRPLQSPVRVCPFNVVDIRRCPAPPAHAMVAEKARYFTTIDPDACSCEGWRWRHDCRHVRELRAALEIIRANELKWRESK